MDGGSIPPSSTIPVFTGLSTPGLLFTQRQTPVQRLRLDAVTRPRQFWRYLHAAERPGRTLQELRDLDVGRQWDPVDDEDKAISRTIGTVHIGERTTLRDVGKGVDAGKEDLAVLGGDQHFGPTKRREFLTVHLQEVFVGVAVGAGHHEVRNDLGEELVVVEHLLLRHAHDVEKGLEGGIRWNEDGHRTVALQHTLQPGGLERLQEYAERLTRPVRLIPGALHHGKVGEHGRHWADGRGWNRRGRSVAQRDARLVGVLRNAVTDVLRVEFVRVHTPELAVRAAHEREQFVKRQRHPVDDVDEAVPGCKPASHCSQAGWLAGGCDRVEARNVGLPGLGGHPQRLPTRRGELLTVHLEEVFIGVPIRRHHEIGEDLLHELWVLECCPLIQTGHRQECLPSLVRREEKRDRTRARQLFPQTRKGLRVGGKGIGT